MTVFGAVGGARMRPRPAHPPDVAMHIADPAREPGAFDHARLRSASSLAVGLEALSAFETALGAAEAGRAIGIAALADLATTLRACAVSAGRNGAPRAETVGRLAAIVRGMGRAGLHRAGADVRATPMRGAARDTARGLASPDRVADGART